MGTVLLCLSPVSHPSPTPTPETPVRGVCLYLESPKSGGVSDPRSAALIKLFNLVNINERAGGGIPNIYSVWRKQGWKLPVLSESYDPDRITLSLANEKTSDKKVGTKSNDTGGFCRKS